MATIDAAVTTGPLRVLAVDGGQSGIRIRHSADTHTIEAQGTSRTADTDARVAGAVVDAWHALGRPAVDRAVLGMTTAPTDATQALTLAQTVGEAIGAPEVWACDDSVTSHAGALSLAWGVSLAAGTGVACLAVPSDGAPRPIGGHGYLIGDEGGAYWIGREGLRAALRAAEGRAEPTALRDLAERRFGPIEAVPVRLHDDERPVDAVAQFAIDVLAAADDPVATAIVRAAAAELHGVISAAARLTQRSTSEPVPVGLGGRLLAAPTPLRRALDARLAADPNLRPRTADHSPLEGAMLLGRQATPGPYADLVHAWHRGNPS